MPAKKPKEESTQLDRIEDAILGNGREGLLDRTARIEEKVITIDESATEAKTLATEYAKKSGEAVEKVANSVGELSTTVSRLTDTMVQHIGTDHSSVLIRKKAFWMLIVVGFISLHLVSTYVPNVWDALMVFLGLPKLVIPLS